MSQSKKSEMVKEIREIVKVLRNTRIKLANAVDDPNLIHLGHCLDGTMISIHDVEDSLQFLAGRILEEL